MAKIRRKTIAPAAGEYLKYAREQGIDLSWNNYERMLPQDGFARLGLSCTDCLMGPCRISPFARDEAKTVCGMDAGDLVYRSVMHTLGVTPGYTKDYMTSILKTVEEHCAAPSRTRDGQAPVGFGVLDRDMINICVESVPFPRLEEIEAAAVGMGDTAASVGAKGFKFSLVGHACSRRSAIGGYADIELAMLTGLVDAYLLGPTAVGLGKNVAPHYHTAVICQSMDAADILKKAAEAFAARDEEKIRPDTSVAVVPIHGLEKLQEIAAGYEKIAVFAGGSNIKLTIGELTAEAIRRLSSMGIACFTFGSNVLTAGKAGLTENVYACGGEVSDILNYEAIRGKVRVVCMPELSSGDDFARALYMGEHGLKVMTATELPIEGCLELADALHARLAYCAHEDYVAKALEIVR
ncbi:MAG: hypothetical protein AB7D36_10825 [Oscillospiraceae bacterium]